MLVQDGDHLTELVSSFPRRTTIRPARQILGVHGVAARIRRSRRSPSPAGTDAPIGWPRH
jgi:hypothetical protein